MPKTFDAFVQDHGLEDLTAREQQELYSQYLDSADNAMDQLREDSEPYGN